MESVMSLKSAAAAATPRVSYQTGQSHHRLPPNPKFSTSPWSISLPMSDRYRGCIRAQQSESKDGSVTLSPVNESEENAVENKELEVGSNEEEVADSQGIMIRRRPSTGPPLHYVGPFEFRIQSEGNTPRNILEEIVWNKDIEVTQMKEKTPLGKMKKWVENAPPVRNFVRALRTSNLRTGLPGLIAEVKKASPSRGVLRENFDPVEIAQAYEKGGAACISVLTDKKYFQGSFENLEAIRNAGVKCPLLCKEFVIDAWQIFYARSKGADAILLIAAVLPDADLKYMTKICKMLGMAALIEVHNEGEMDRVLGIDGVQLIGINNRDLETFELDISTTKKLLEGERGQLIRRKDIVVVGESGLFTPADIAYVQESGVKAMRIRSLRFVIVATLSFLSIMERTVGIRFVIDREECFSHNAQYEGDTVHVSFVVIKTDTPWHYGDEGVDLVINGPSGEHLYDVHDKISEKYEFMVRNSGIHRFCFNNKSPYHETIDFDIHVGHFTYLDQHAKDEHFKPVLEQILKLEEALYNIQFEQHWLEAQTDRQAIVDEGMSRKAIYKAMFESAALIGASVLQVYLLQRLFERKLRTSRV
ncbi:hypothetical protein RHGRI_009735 [Rhododendron griersonianum]|uniref:indole-3-glycerol-phosphate synthase n=1 Tax=Rhododendron griersonianum TaxID=479676 RepID=A0AAV6KG40_9ERIC|nr:hypothetical protein RHGRI_009735 [Rhododendron griersonianum]